MSLAQFKDGPTGPRRRLAESSWRRMERPLPEKFVTWACWVESEGLFLGTGQPSPATFSSYLYQG